MRAKVTAKQLLLEYLKTQGLVAKRSKVGVNFDYEGWNFLLWNDVDDPMFFRLALPGILDVTDENYARALMACNSVNWNYKVVKASLYDYEEAGRRHASVWVCYEQVIDDGHAVSADFVPRTINALVDVAEKIQALTEK